MGFFGRKWDGLVNSVQFGNTVGLSISCWGKVIKKGTLSPEIWQAFLGFDFFVVVFLSCLI